MFESEDAKNTHSLFRFTKSHTSMHVQSFNHVRLLVTPCTVTWQAPLSTGFSRQEYWSGLPFPSPRDLPNPGIEPVSPVSPALQVDSLPAETLYGIFSKN